VSQGERLGRVLDVLEDASDILQGRVHEPRPPSWCEARGWSDFLVRLDDDALHAAEREGLAAIVRGRRDVPTDLAELARRVDELAAVPSAASTDEVRPIHRAKLRKQAQVEALSSLARTHLSPPKRIVDVGAGHGHLTRALARALGSDAVGLDRDPERVRAARELTNDGPAFERWDASTTPLALEPSDLVVGLHACGDLGDVIVERAAGTGADVLLVSCCLQKIARDVRRPLSAVGRARGFLAPRPILGLANLSARADGVESSMDAIMESRRTRYALRLLLVSRGEACAPGEEARGINRRRMRQGLPAVAEIAFDARGLAPASASEIERAAAEAREAFAVIRRLSLPRAMLARLLELAVVLDRAAALEDAGHGVVVVAAFRAKTSPRNLTIIAEGGA